MKKRIMSLLLALLMVVSMFPAEAFAVDAPDVTDAPTEAVTEAPTIPATEGATESCTLPAAESAAGAATEAPTEAVIQSSAQLIGQISFDANLAAATAEESTKTSDPTEGATEPLCAYCEATAVEDGTVTHEDTCNTLFVVDASADVGKTAAFSMMYVPALYTTEKPTSEFDYDLYDEDGEHDFLEAEYNYDDAPLVKITDWCWEVSGPTLWYQVEPLAGETLPDGLTTDSWILQRYTNDADSINTLIITDLSVIGKHAKFIEATAALYDAIEGDSIGVDGTAMSVMVVTDLYTDGVSTWYYVDAAEGETWPEAYAGYNYVLSTDVTFVTICPDCGKPDCTTEHTHCPICGGLDCTDVHNICSVCGKTNCTAAHVYCLACGKPDCTETHTYCPYCNTYDSCDIDHAAANKPITAPVLPEEPTLPEDVEIGIYDELGDILSELILFSHERTSISAWPELEGSVSYQWQIRYDAANDLWTNIRGQDGQGIVLSPAMVANVADPAIRCVATSGDATLTSEAIPVSVSSAVMATGYNVSRAAAGEAATIDDTAEPEKVTIVVKYLFTDNTIAANPWVATLPKGEAYTSGTPITVPVIPGYTATIDSGLYGDKAVLADGKLTLNFTAEDMNSDQTINIVYQPAPVKVVVNHHWQNVEDDNYTLRETVTYDATTEKLFETGDPITKADIDKSYEGFYVLLHEEPVAAADGSTVVDVYYDRYYYLIKFDLGGGYGVDPVYGRFGAPLPVDTPTRPGYSFAGWSLDGQTEIQLPTEIPAQSTTYIALWAAGDPVNYTIVYWKENADDTNYSYWTQQTATAIPGTLVSGSNSVAPYVDDEQYFTYNDALTDKDVEIEGDGSTVINVYYNRNYYTIYFKGYGKCALGEHTHGTNCVSELICGLDGHVHDATCKRTLICGETEHTHTNACLICTKPIHAEHTLEDCYVLDCNETSHDHTDAGCTLECTHTTHDLTCYTTGYGRDLETTQKPTQALTSVGNGIYTYTGTSWGYERTYYYLNIGNTWYWSYYGIDPISFNCSHICDDSCYTCGKTQGNHVHTVEGGCYELICGLEIHTKHTDAAGCYKDLAHTHTEECYTYECNIVPHTHTADCYRECYKPEHTHESDCTSNQSDNVIYVITAKYEQNIDSIWPTYDQLKAGDYAYEDGDGNVENANGSRFRGWDIDGVSNEAVSKRVTMTADLCDTSDGVKNATAQYSASYLYKLYYMFESFDQTSGENGNDRRYYDSASQGVEAKYYDSSATFYQELYYSSDTTFNQKQITGMNAVGVEKETTGREQTGNYVIYNFLYYTRNRWTLRFHNVSEVVKTQTNVMFEQPLANYKDNDGNLLSAYVPPYPTDSYEADTMVFEGWYITPECFEGTKVNFANLTMPNNDMTLYAHWVPVSRTVRFFLDKEALDAGTIIPEQMEEVYAALHDGETDSNSPYTKFNTRTDVPNKSFLTDVSTPGVSEGYTRDEDKNIDGHPYEGYTFVGWFYIEDGEEKAFDPKNMPVTKDLDLYGKWSSNVLCPYEIRYALDSNGDGVADVDANGNIIYVADPITGSTLAGNSRTFDAKGDTALYARYQSGYYPNVASHTIEFKASDEAGVVYTFYYTPADPVEYKVFYVAETLKDGEDATKYETIKRDDKTYYIIANTYTNSENRKAVVTENFVPVAGYMPDAYQKKLIVVPGGVNEIIFYYTVDTVHAFYQVNHYVQNLDGNGWIEYRSADFTGDIGKEYSASALTITGFTYSEEQTDALNDAAITVNGTTVKGTLTNQGMQLNLYYTRNTHTYKVQYLEHGSNVVLADDKTVENVLYGTYVTENAITIQKDMDGDGKYEDFQLFEATDPSQSATITDDTTVFTFYYVRCTAESLSVTKVLTGEGADQNLVFNFSLTSTATDFATVSNGSYEYVITGGESGYKTVDDGKITFSLKAGQTITFTGLPTAVYTIAEESSNLPLGYYYKGINPEQPVTLTKDAKVDVTVTNEYKPAKLTVTKTVTGVESTQEFSFKVTFGNNGSSQEFTLSHGETKTFDNIPLGNYTVEELNVPNGFECTSTGATGEAEVGGTYEAAFTNEYKPAKLTVTKTVDTAGAYAAPNKDFTFKVVFSDGKSYGYTKDGEAGTLTDDGTLTLKAGESAVFANLPVGITYTVTEQNLPTYFTQTAATGVSGKTELAGAYTAAFTNTYTLPEVTYIVKYLEEGTNNVLAHEKSGSGLVTQTATENAIDITNYTLDGEATKTITLVADPSQNVIIFYYTRDTGSLSVTKSLTGTDLGNSFNFTLISTAAGFADCSYAYVIKSGATEIERGTKTVVSDKIDFSLKTGQTITFSGLPTGGYTVTEGELPLGYYCDEPTKSVTLDKGETENVTINNEYAPASLEISKVVNRIENVTDNVSDFEFYITVPTGITGTYSYTVDGVAQNATVADGKITITLKDGGKALFANLPVGAYTVAEKDYADKGYSATYVDNDATDTNADNTDGMVTLVKDEKATVTCTNAYPVGSLTITKTVQKAYANDVWTGDTFTFTVKRTDGNLNSPSYPVYSGTTKFGDAVVKADGTLEVTITFTDLGTKTIKIDNLPKGDYTVVENLTEKQAKDYTTTPGTSVPTSISPQDYAGVAEFTNTYKKHLGNLIITKTVTALGGYTAPEDASFGFVVSGTALRKDSYWVTITDANGQSQKTECNVTNGKLATIALKGGQTAMIEDLALDSYTVTETPDSRFVQTAAAGTTGTINAEDTAKAEFTNTYVPRGNLILKKYIDRGTADFVEIDADQEFVFTVALAYTLDNAETYRAKIYTIDNDSGVSDSFTESDLALSADKNLTFKLKHNQYIVIEGLPAVGYTITEGTVLGYKTPIYDESNSGTIPAGGTAEVVCRNPVQLVCGDLKITKVIEDQSNNQSAPREQAFVFTVTLRNATELKSEDGTYQVEYTCDPAKGTLVAQTGADGTVTYTYAPKVPADAKTVSLPNTVTVEEWDMEESFTLTLYDGLTAIIKDLPPCGYSIEEADYSEQGFGASWNNGKTGFLGGAMNANSENPVSEATCTNVFPIDRIGQLIIKKQVTKDYVRDVLRDDTFTFTVKPATSNLNTLQGEYTCTVSAVNNNETATTLKVTATETADEKGELVISIPYRAAELVMGLNDSRTKLLTIDGLPFGEYVVVETEDADYRQEPDTRTRSVTVGTNPGEAVFINRYKRHLGNIQITKNLEDGSTDDGSDFLFHVINSSGKTVASITLKAGETKTIWDLPLGAYTVKEDTSWNWRYNLTSANNVQVTLSNGETDPVTVEVAFTNAYENSKWINFVTSMKNIFTKQ